MKINNPGTLSSINYIGTDDYGGLKYYPLQDPAVTPPGIYVAKETMKWYVDANMSTVTAGPGSMAIIVAPDDPELDDNTVLWCSSDYSQDCVWRMNSASMKVRKLRNDTVVRGEALDTYVRACFGVNNLTLSPSGEYITGGVERRGITTALNQTGKMVSRAMTSTGTSLAYYMVTPGTSMLGLSSGTTYIFTVTEILSDGAVLAEYRPQNGGEIYVLSHPSSATTATITKISLLEDSLTSTSTSTALTANQERFGF